MLRIAGFGAYIGTPRAPRRPLSDQVVWDYLSDCLRALAAQPELTARDVSERRLTAALLDELEARTGDRPFYFHKEPGEPVSRRSADLDVRPKDDQTFVVEGRQFSGRQRFVVLEAKRLPAPEKPREQEYLHGELGGVERFKRGYHAAGLLTVGMIGYLQSGDASSWYTTVNSWVDALIARGSSDLTWDAEDRLTPEPIPLSPPVSAFRSRPLRRDDGQRLVMRHLWVQLVQAASPTTP